MSVPDLPPAKFGTVLGHAPGGVPVYSSDYDSADPAEYPNRAAFRHVVDGITMGHKWQCVEFARRWLYETQGLIFRDVAMAYDIFQLRSLREVESGALHPLKSFRNGAKRRPEPGALLIWNEGGEFVVTGHVAVVTEVFPDRVRVAEQNVDNRPWPPGRTYSRELRAKVGADGSYWVECTFGDATVLGWVIRTDDPTHAETIADADPRLFDLIPRAVAPKQPEGAVWLDPAVPEEAAYMAGMGGSKMASHPENERRYFLIGETAERELKRATNELHAMFLHATHAVLQDDDLLRRFNLPPVLWPRLRRSWENRRTRMITGRFDFSLSSRGLKVYEYNADSASCHMECGRVQCAWAHHYGCTEGRCSGAELHPDLIAAWKTAGISGTLHIMRDHDAEETYHALFMKAAIEAAGIPCKIITGVSGLRRGEGGRVVDAEGEAIRWVWKTWAWETVIDQIRAECAADEEDMRLHRARDPNRPPRLADVLLGPDVMVFEPLWTLIPSNKAILPILWEMYPRHPYLLATTFDLTAKQEKKGYVVKPIVGRCGSNISIVDVASGRVAETAGRFGDRNQIFQELFPLPVIDGLFVQVGTFSVAGRYAGANVRVDVSPIITTGSDLLPLRIVPDAEILAQPGG
ncbi:bifunctional glutathionylspermidine amidase/synthase [Oleispirillum naphthae]|uniref:bifunctional glutathionylspermidine amidase/synthase n=1 Tax=Oleispirillum naphthae TaxID=2838853 RepID=UPI0030823556